jgi:hypothetical protein
MKKTFRQEDGTLITIEGTADEIGQYERIVENDRRGQEPKKQRPDVLKGALTPGADQIRKILEDLGMGPQPQETRLTEQPILPWTTPWQPTWCIRCGGSPCMCYHVYPSWPLYPQIWCKTVTVTGDSTLPASTHVGFAGPGMY